MTIVAYPLALIIFMELCNKMLSWFGDLVGVTDVTLEVSICDVIMCIHQSIALIVTIAAYLLALIIIGAL